MGFGTLIKIEGNTYGSDLRRAEVLGPDLRIHSRVQSPISVMHAARTLMITSPMDPCKLRHDGAGNGTSPAIFRWTRSSDFAFDVKSRPVQENGRLARHYSNLGKTIASTRNRIGAR